MRLSPRVALILSLVPTALAAQSAPTDSVAAVDRVFSSWNTRQSPGCAVGVARNGQTILERAYGMANLEYDVPNTPTTIFEAGSVSKQFTAAAVALLAQQGKLSLDDDIRKYLPEVPDYGTPITIRQMLNHTSGLRDWGTVAAAMGWPRGTRVHTHAHVLDIVSHQKALNYKPGAEYLYSNTNYNLAAIIVERVSGTSFAEFTRKNIFEPLGMTSTQWRDDFTRIVKGRSTAYSPAGTGWRLEMPFENVHGNGGLLTTVGDLLKWNENFVSPHVGGVGFVRDLQQRGRLNSGREISYALGLVVGSYQGVPEVSHTGATAGYRAFLGRYPDQRLSIAVLCNTANANPGRIGAQVADVFLAGQTRVDARQAGEPGIALPPEQIAEKVAVYRNFVTNEPLRLIVRDGKLRVDGGPELTPTSRTVFRDPFGGVGTFEFGAKGLPAIFRVARPDGDTASYLREESWSPSVADLRQYVGDYDSDEAEVTYSVVLAEDGKLMLRDRYGRAMELVPAYRHAFTTSQGPDLVLFRRDARGRVTTMSFGMGRVRDLEFRRAR